MTRERILVALSGGVDSSVAALLLEREGHDVTGAYMKNWINEDNVIGHCPWRQDIADARAVAERIGIPFRVVNLMADYRRLVVDHLLDGYRRGLTPNPDVMCNREMKFGVFANYARAEGFTALATGHYARRVAGADGGARNAERGAPEHNPHKPDSSVQHFTALAGGHYARRGAAGASLADARDGRALWAVSQWRDHHAVERADLSALSQTNALGSTRSTPGIPHSALRTPQLWEATDKNKDQSYFLALLSPGQLDFARFPIGHLKKPELRALAREAGLPNAGKKDSQGICFIGEVKMADFLKAYVPEHPGPIVRATDGKVLGEHRGLHYYTIGQRRGIRIPSNTDNQAYVVTGKRTEDHALLVAFDGPDAPGLWTDTARIHSLSWLAGPITPSPSGAAAEPRRLECRVRYRDPRVPIEFIPNVGRGLRTPPLAASIKFDTTQRALAPGQILALYDGERLLGGGVFA